MKRNNLTKSLIILLSVCILVCSVPGQSYAKWPQNQLPGIVSDSEITNVAILGGGVLVLCGLVGLIVYSTTSKDKIASYNPVNFETSQITVPNYNSYQATFQLKDKVDTRQFILNRTSIPTVNNSISLRLPVDFYVSPIAMSQPFDTKVKLGVGFGMKIRF